VFDYLRMTENARRRPPVRLAPVGKNGPAVAIWDLDSFARKNLFKAS